MSYGRHNFTTASGREFREDEINNGPSYVGESIAIEKEERGAAMTLPQKFYYFGERAGFILPLPPFCFNRCIAF